MKLDYATLISPYSLYISNIGHVKSPLLSEIWNPKITYKKYSHFLSLLVLTPQLYCENVNPLKLEWYNGLSDDDKNKLSMVYFIKNDKQLQNNYSSIFNFFFEENVIWNDSECVFFTYIETDDKGNIIPTGIIHSEIFAELCDVILQLCGVNSNDTKKSKLKFKNKAAKRIWEKTQNIKNKQNEKYAKNLELPNIISAVSAFSKTLNIITIWDLTVYQVYDQFQRIKNNVLFDINSTFVAAHGDSDGNFNPDQWYEYININ